jgi:hypothetical protein
MARSFGAIGVRGGDCDVVIDDVVVFDVFEFCDCFPIESLVPLAAQDGLGEDIFFFFLKNCSFKKKKNFKKKGKINHQIKS